MELSDHGYGTNSTGVSLPNGASSGYEKRELKSESRVRRTLEKSWPIAEQLKNEKAEDLFEWIGERIVEVVGDGQLQFPDEVPKELPMGVTFSFPMM